MLDATTFMRERRVEMKKDTKNMKKMLVMSYFSLVFRACKIQKAHSQPFIQNTQIGSGIGLKM